MAFTTGLEADGDIEAKEHGSRNNESSIMANGRLRREYRSSQKLDRYISFVPSIAFDATLQASWEAAAASFQAGLLNGGPTALVWGTLLTWIGTTAMAASLGEMASINPTVGAQYRWTALYAPRGFLSPAFWSLLQGWITVFAFMATCAQVAFLEGGIVQGLIIFNNPNPGGYEPKLWHGTLLAWAILALPLLCNIFARRLLPSLEIIGGVGHIVFFIIIVVTLSVMATRSSAEFVFTGTVFGLSGWENSGVQWCIGLLSAAFPLGSFDGVVHMGAEVKNAPKRIPQSMVSSVLINGAFLFGFMICIMFTVGDVKTVLASPTNYPIIAVLYQATKSHAATTVLMSCIVFMGIVALFSTLASVSRLVWAFARDRGLPFSDFFAQVHPTLRIPINALGLVVTVVVLITLISVGNTTAFFAILSLNTLALYISYLIPMIFFTLAKLRGDHIPYGPFQLGRFGLPINIFAIAYAIFIAVFLPFPSSLPVTAQNMNYGGPVIGAVILFALCDWVISGRKRFKGPLDRADIEMEDKNEANP